jgi:hypothetical protein
MRPAQPPVTPRPALCAGLGRNLALALILAGSLLCVAPCAAQAGKELLRSEFWAEIEPVAAVGEEWPVTPREARSRILAEAAWVFGGMIWGFEFSYTPYDRTRALEERFDIAPIETLPADAPTLAPGALANISNEFHSIAQYRPEAALVSLMEGYASEPWKGAQGVGKADMDRGVKGRREAYKDGLRTAVRSLLQGLEPNKPRLVRGRAVFDAPPTLAIIDGYYTAQVRARIMVIEVIPYKVY